MSTAFTERLRREYAEALPALPAGVATPQLRGAALEQAAALGLPALREDAFRYASLRPLEKARLVPAARPTEADEARAASRLPAAVAGFTRYVFVNGRFAPSLSAAAGDLPGGQFQARSHAPPAGGAAVFLLKPGAEERFAWLNDAFAVDTAALGIAGAARVEVVFLEVPTADGGAGYPRLEVRVAAGARLELIERHLGSGGAHGLINGSVQLELAADAAAEHYRWQGCDADATVLDTLLATVGDRAHYTLSLISLGAAAARSAQRIRLAGVEARASVNGMSLADAKCVIDTSILVEHAGRATRSEQLLRGIANDRSAISFNSRVEVAASAGGADSRQSLKGLIGGHGAEVNLRPQLEILTDEVSASHGATTGALDENTLFYLLSRGLDPHTARQLLEWAFIEAVMSRIGDASLRRQVELATVKRLGNAAALEAVQ